MKNILNIVIISKDFHFQGQIQAFLQNLSQIQICEEMKDAHVIITDGTDQRVYKEDMPIFTIAKQKPENLPESEMYRFYSIETFNPIQFLADLQTWLSIWDTISELMTDAEYWKGKAERRKKKREEVEDSISAANALQQYVMTPPTLEHYQIAYHYQPTSLISGDFFHIREQDNRLFLLVGDVIDHGYEKGMYNASLISMMDSYFALITKPDFVAWVQFMQSQCLSYNYQDYRRLITSAIFCELDPMQQKLRILSCGHQQEAPFILHHTEIQKVQISKDLYSLGSEYQELASIDAIQEYEFDTGDSLLLYTDGITEIFKTKKEDLEDAYGEKRLKNSIQQILTRSRSWTPEQLIDGIVKDIYSYAFPNTGNDDATLLVVQQK